jgi:hypothetical protein
LYSFFLIEKSCYFYYIRVRGAAAFGDCYNGAFAVNAVGGIDEVKVKNRGSSWRRARTEIAVPLKVRGPGDRVPT